MNTNLSLETALVVLIPEAETLVQPFRSQFDPSASLGVPAHVTILYPFKSPDELTDGVINSLRNIFINLPSFDVSFSEIKIFPDTIFLAPDPSEPFRQLTRQIVKHFPDEPPYHGIFKEIIPHLTVAQNSDPQQLKIIRAEFLEAVLPELPIHTIVNQVYLLENLDGLWQGRAQFALSQVKHDR